MKMLLGMDGTIHEWVRGQIDFSKCASVSSRHLGGSIVRSQEPMGPSSWFEQGTLNVYSYLRDKRCPERDCQSPKGFPENESKIQI